MPEDPAKESGTHSTVILGSHRVQPNIVPSQGASYNEIVSGYLSFTVSWRASLTRTLQLLPLGPSHILIPFILISPIP